MFSSSVRANTAVEYAAKESATAVYNPEVNNLLVVRMTRLIPVFC